MNPIETRLPAAVEAAASHVKATAQAVAERVAAALGNQSQLATRIASGDVPANLSGKRVFKLELGTLFGDVKDSAEASGRIEAIVNDLGRTRGEVILFVGELTNFVGNSQINDKLAESLLQGKVQIIGGSNDGSNSNFGCDHSGNYCNAPGYNQNSGSQGQSNNQSNGNSSSNSGNGSENGNGHKP